jgi:hypothetical protein
LLPHDLKAAIIKLCRIYSLAYHRNNVLLMTSVFTNSLCKCPSSSHIRPMFLCGFHMEGSEAPHQNKISKRRSWIIRCELIIYIDSQPSKDSIHTRRSWIVKIFI